MKYWLTSPVVAASTIVCNGIWLPVGKGSASPPGLPLAL